MILEAGDDFRFNQMSGNTIGLDNVTFSSDYVTEIAPFKNGEIKMAAKNIPLDTSFSLYEIYRLYSKKLSLSSVL